MESRIILIDTQYGKKYDEVNLGLLSIGTLLKKSGYDVFLLKLSENELERLDDFINKNTLCIGFSVKTNQIKSTLLLSKYIKKRYSNIKIVWGGVHVKLFPKQVLENKNIDIVVFGDGEYTMLEIAKRLKDKKSLKGIKGCGYKSKVKGQTKLIFNKPREFTDISKLPESDFSIIANIEKYIKDSKGGRHCCNESFFPIQSSIGCPFNCSFCYNTIREKRRERKVETMLNEIEYLQKKYNINYFRLNDELFFSNKKKLQEFIKKKKKRNLKFKWESNGHVIFFKDNKFYSDKFIKGLRQEGLIATAVGVESGSLSQLKRYRKNILPEEVVRVAKRMESLKIHTLYSFMIGAPYETYDDMVDTVKLVYKIGIESPNYSFLQYPQIFRPYPGCDLYEEAIKLGFKQKEKLEDWTMISKLTGYTSYDELPYLKQILPKIYNVLYHFKFIKFLFTRKYLLPILRKRSTYKILTNKYIVNHLGHLVRRTLENRFFDKLISQKLFGRSLINVK